MDSQHLRTGNLSDDEWEKLIESAGVIGKSNLIIDDTPGISISELRSKCRKYKLEVKERCPRKSVSFPILSLQISEFGKIRQPHQLYRTDRYYTMEDVRQFKEIKMLKEQGLQLKAIKTILQKENGEMSMADKSEMLSFISVNSSLLAFLTVSTIIC